MSLIDSQTLHLLEHQSRRLRAEKAKRRTDEPLIATIRKNIDDILDRRTRPIAVASDGEAIFPGASPWVADQALTQAANLSGEAELILTAPEWDKVHGVPAADELGPTLENQIKEQDLRTLDQARKDLGL